METKQQTNEVFNFTKERNFTQISNELLSDKRLTFGARGLLSMMLSRPKNWQFFKGELVSNTTETEYAVTKLLKELSEKKYIYKFQVGVKGEVKKFKWLWFINEIPFTDEQIKYIDTKFRSYDTIKSTTSCNYDNRKSGVYSNTDVLSNTNINNNNNKDVVVHGLTSEQKKFNEDFKMYEMELSMLIRSVIDMNTTPKKLFQQGNGDFKYIKNKFQEFKGQPAGTIISAIKNNWSNKKEEKKEEKKANWRPL